MHSLPDRLLSVHGILQARILDWVAILFPRGSSRPRDRTRAPALQETWVLSLGWEDLLEEGVATQSSILAWRIPWTEEPGGLQFMGSPRVDTTEVN